jgi:hypothetical protein
MIDQFTREEFENYLSIHSPFSCLGLIQGEEAYLIPLDEQTGIMVRSSVKKSGVSAGTSKNSIRAWLVSGSKPLGSKISKWITRQPGWQERVDEQIKQLTLWRALAGDCKECDKPKGIFIAHTEKNDGRPFARCKEHKDSFQWLDEKIKASDIYFSKLSQGDDDENANDGKSEDVNDNSKMEVLAQDRPKSRRNSLRDWATVDENKYPGKQSETTASVPEVSKIKSQMAQKKAIEADINNDVRVLAGPGSGKTFIIERRYKHLVENGVKPENILVCTFGKDASTNMGQRILRTCPEANLEQISTIHAFCSRLLTKWDQGSKYYKWNVPFDWKVKSEIEGLIERIWSGEKPNAKEVLDKINLSKEQGLTVEESYTYFVNTLGSKYGTWLHKIRSDFDAWLERNRFLTFTECGELDYRINLAMSLLMRHKIQLVRLCVSW